MSNPNEKNRPFPIVIAARPIDTTQYVAAFTMIGAMVLSLGILLPFSSIQFARVDRVLPVVQTVISIVCLMTTALLFAQYSVQPDRRLLFVAAGYNCWGYFAFLQTFAAPFEYMANGLIGDGRNSASWVFWLWHVSFPLSVLIYTFAQKEIKHVSLSRSVIPPIAMTIGVVAAVAGAIAWLVTAGVSYLPNLSRYMANREPLAYYFVSADLLLTVMVTALLLYRGRTILDLWLTVVLVATSLDLIVSAVLRPSGFSVGWYAGRGYALVASSTALLIMLVETIVLYGRLANLLVLLWRERDDRFMSLDAATGTMAHELRQPLTAVESNASAALNWLNKPTPEIDEARAAVRAIIDVVRRAEAVISSVRELFRREAGHRLLVEMGEVVREAVVLMRPDLRANQISIQAKYGQGLPLVLADRLQLQQAVLNLIKNAIDAMSSVSPMSRHLAILTLPGPHSTVRLIIKDSGRGIRPVEQGQIFETFFTTKAAGMGLGLSICRSIIAAHGGTLRVLRTDAGGTAFEIALPVA